MATTTAMSFEEFERLEEGPDHIELLKGELIRVPPAQKRHSQVVKRLFRLLDTRVEALRLAFPGLTVGEVYVEMGYRFPGAPQSWLQPDVSLTHPNQPGDRYFEGAPLMAFEVVSEYDTARELDAKVAEYLANGAAEVWLIYPDKRHAWVYDGSGIARQETQSIHTALLAGVDIALSEIL